MPRKVHSGKVELTRLLQMRHLNVKNTKGSSPPRPQPDPPKEPRQPPEAKVSKFNEGFSLRLRASGHAPEIEFSRPGAQQPAWTPPGEAKVDYSSTLGTHWAKLVHESSTLGTHRHQKTTSF